MKIMMPLGTVLLFIVGSVFLLINTASSQTCTPACTDKQYCGTNSTGHALCLSCNVGCNGCTGGGDGNCKLCADRYYNDTSTFTCEACDSACTECTGGARTMCKACDLGYQLIGTTCQACTEEHFGQNCTGICRCLNVEKCRDTDGRCDDWTCQWGWTNPPYCDQECSYKFGINCENDCHCPVNDTCDKINGACGSNKCEDGYAGAGCQTELPKFRIPPIVKDNQCGNVTIEWNAWSPTEDIGVGPVAKYNVYYRHNNMSSWVLNNTWGEVSHVDTITRYSLTVTGFDFMLLYQFRVDVVRKDGDKISKDITLGYPTDELQLSCPEKVSTTTVAPTTVTPLQPPPVEKEDLKILHLLDDIDKIIDRTSEENFDIEITFNNYIKILEGLQRCGYNIQKTLPIILQHLDDNIELPTKISNLTKKVRKHIDDGKDGDICISFLYKDMSNDFPSYFTKNGVSFSQLVHKEIPKGVVCVDLTVRHILYLRRMIIQKNLPWSYATYWITHLQDLDMASVHVPLSEKSLRTQWNSLHKTFKYLRTSKRQGNEEDLQCFLDGHYYIPENRPQKMPYTAHDRSEKLIEQQQHTITKLRLNLVKTYNELLNTTEEVNHLLLENNHLEQKIKIKQKLECDLKQKTTQVHELKQKIASLNPKNVNKKLKRKQETIQILRNKVETQNNEMKSQGEIMNARMKFILNENDALEKELEELSQKVKDTNIKRQKDLKLKSYYKCKIQKNSLMQREDRQKLKDAEKLIEELNRYIENLESTDVDKKEKIQCFSEGRYSDEIRQVYMDLLGCGVSIEQCQNVVQSVLKNLLDVEVDRLPKKSLASIISIEAHVLSQAQAAESMLRRNDNCLHLDGTKKSFTEYSGFQVSNEEGSFSLSHQIMAKGDAESYLHATNETLEELAESLTENECDKNEITADLKSRIANVMTDRHIVNKKYKSLLEEQIGSHVNGMFCGLHVLPNMASAALTGMEQFEKSQNDIPSVVFQTKSAANSLIYECAKAFIEISGCQKSGDAIDFNDYLSSLNIKNQLVTFLHNRFNILFLDGGAVFYHRNHIYDYLSSGRSSKCNKLLTSIQSLITSKSLLAECRALGIIGKLICGPLWRLLEDTSITYFGMNDYWQILVEKVSDFVEDASPLLSGEGIFQEAGLVDKDEIYNSLFQSDDELDPLTISALEHILQTILPMLQRQLKDQLPGGSMFVPTEEQHLQCKYVPKTNRISEADFSALDRISRKAPQKRRSSKSAQITYTVNRTSKFIRQISKEKKNKYFRIARKVAKRRILWDKEKVLNVRQERMQDQQQRVERKERARERERELTSKLEKQMREEGVWTSETEGEKALSGKSENQKRALIGRQLRYHSKVLKSTIPKKYLLKLQKNKNKLTSDELFTNLKRIMSANFCPSVPQSVIEINMSVPPKRCRTMKRKNTQSDSSSAAKKSKISFQINTFYAVAFMDRWYPGRCEKVVDDETAVLKFLVPSGKQFKWPMKADVQQVKLIGCLAEITVEPVSNGRLWIVKEHLSVDQLFKSSYDTVFRDFQVTLSQFTVYVNWSLIGNSSGINIDSVTLYYGVLQLEDCPVFAEPNYTTVHVANVNGWTSPELLPWRKYEVKIVVETAYNSSAIKKDDREEIQTPQAEPTGAATKLKVESITSYRATASWQDPVCGQKGGPLKHYGVSYMNLNDTGAGAVITSVRFQSYVLTKLNPYTVYSFRVQYVNDNGKGPWSSEVYFTTEEAAPSAPAITNLTAGVNNIIVKWTAPLVLNGIIREYMVFYSLSANFSDEVQKSTIDTSITVTGLLPFQTYHLKVKARTTPGSWGNFSETKSVTTLEDFPSAPESLDIVSRNESCLGVVWSAPLNPNGNIVQYKIRHAPTSGEWSSDILFPSTVNSADVCNLLPYRSYMIEVRASTSRGFGPERIAINMTEIGTPPDPPSPTFINVTENRIAVSINPVVISTGPLVSYKIYVHDITVNLDPPVAYPGYLAAVFPAENITTSKVFIVGDGRVYGAGVNKELILNHRYNIYLQIESSLDGITKTSNATLASVLVAVPATTSKPGAVPVAATENGDNTGVIVAVVVIILLLLIAVVVIVIIVWYRRRNTMGKYTYQSYVNEKDHYQMEPVKDDYDPHKYWNTIYSYRESRYITAGRELLLDEPMIANGTLGRQTGLPPVTFSQEFHDLPHGQLSSWNAAVLRKNAGKNRFPHLLPYDHSRVVLQPDEHAKTDYINANHIHGFKRPNAYIAAQSPFDEDTVLDFWRMLYQKNVKIVVMITNLVEDRIVKCTQYWPDPEQGKVKYGGFLLELVDIRYFADYIIRTVKVKEKNNSKQKFVYLFEYCSWPDHGVPDDPIPLLEMRNKICEYQGNDTSPLLVHCGTGVSRTGTYIAIDLLLQQYDADGRISVFSCVRRLRKDRVAMVRTVKQYVFIYETIFEAKVAGDCRTGADLKAFYHILTKKNLKTKRTYLRDQFAALQRYTRKITPKQCSNALSPANLSKNRFPDVVPSDAYRPVLDTPIGYNETDYVNAVYLDSHKQRNHFIITQTPLHTTVSDFWKLVYDMDVSTIVMMETYNNDDDTCAQYWPEHCVKKYEPFFVDNTEVYQQDNVTIRHFKVTNMHYPRTPARDVRQFQFNAWDDPEFVPKSKTMLLDLISQVNDWQMEANSNQQPVIVHCKDGATHSGLFCAASVICEAMLEDGNVDLFHTVKHMKRRRTQIVDMLDQYRYCYKVLWDFMNLRMEGGTLTNMMNHTSNDPLYVGSLSLPSYVSHLEYM